MGVLFKNDKITITDTKKESSSSDDGWKGQLLLVILVAVIFACSYLYKCSKKKLGFFENYITLQQESGLYKNLEEDPKDKQITLLPENTQLKPLKLITKDHITWIYGWYLNNNTPEKGYVLITNKVSDVEDKNDYFIYGKSEIWDNYYKSIDTLNLDLYNQTAAAFFNEISKYPILSTSDNIEKEKIGKDDSIENISKDGFFGKCKTNDKTTFYCKKDDLKKIEELYENYKEKYEKSKKQYLPE